MTKRLERLYRKMFCGRDRGPRKVKWQPWSSQVGATLVRARLEGRWEDGK